MRHKVLRNVGNVTISGWHRRLCQYIADVQAPNTFILGTSIFKNTELRHVLVTTHASE